MPANEELLLLAKILEVGDLRTALEEGITASFFKDDGARQVWKEIVSFYHSQESRGHVPTRERIEKLCPSVPLPPPGKLPLKAYIKDVVDLHTSHVLAKIADDILDNNREGHLDDLIDRTMRSLSELARDRRTGQDILISDYVEAAKERYESFENATGYRGIPYPWKPLNDETQGMHPGELIIFYGRPKSMKTWVLLYIAAHAYDGWNRRVLLYTREMTPEQMVDRTICILINAPYQYYKTGRLHEIPVPEGGTMKDRWAERLGTIKIEDEVCRDEYGHERAFIITSDRHRSGRGGGVVGLQQKIWDHKPDLICVDAVYLMRNDKSGNRSIKWDEQAALIQDLKDLALDVGKPIVVTTQANRDSEDRDEDSMKDIAFADAYGMNCDLAIRVRKKETPEPYVNELALIVSGAREISMHGFAIHGNPASDFSVLMKKARTEEGLLVLDEDGNPVMEPVVFRTSQQKRDYLRGIHTDGPEVPRRPVYTPGELSNVVRKVVAGEFSKPRKQ